MKSPHVPTARRQAAQRHSKNAGKQRPECVFQGPRRHEKSTAEEAVHTVCKASEGPRLGLLQLAQLGGDDLEKEPQSSLVQPFIRAKFPGRPCAVAFDFDEPPTAKEVFEIAVAAKSAGWKIAKEQFEEQRATRSRKTPRRTP